MNSRDPSLILIDALPATWIERIFDKMLLEYGKKFVDQWSGTDPDKLVAHWATELSGYTGIEIKRGLDAMKKEWPPTLPEFKNLCRHQADSTESYWEAIEGLQERLNGRFGTWTHPAIYNAARSLSYDLLSQPHAAMKSRWQVAIDREMSKNAWEAIPAPSLALPAPPKELDRKAASEQLKSLGVVNHMTQTVDHKRWAKVIKARELAKDKTLTAYQIQQANIALNNSESK